MNDDFSRQSPSVLTSSAGSPRSPQSDGAATPTPWVVDASAEACEGNVYSSDRTGSIVATCKGFQFAPRSKAEILANAELIVKAVNSHAELLAALKDAEEYLELILSPCDPGCECVLHPVQAAIARAEGRS